MTRRTRSTNGPEITLVVLDGCPNAEIASTRLRQALNNLGREGTTPKLVVVSSGDEDDLAGLRGSPTFLVDGVDPFRVEGGTSWACRLYLTETGLQGAPSVAQLEELFR